MSSRYCTLQSAKPGTVLLRTITGTVELQLIIMQPFLAARKGKNFVRPNYSTSSPNHFNELQEMNDMTWPAEGTSCLTSALPPTECFSRIFSFSFA